MMTRIRLTLAAIALIALAGTASAEEKQVPESAMEMQLSFAPIVKRVAPAVVNVYATRVAQQRISPFFNDPFFRRFFGPRPDGGGPPGLGGPSQRLQRSLGSGVIVDPSGLLITNYHVIANADEVKVALADRREFDCDIILKDERTDLAILKLRDAEGPFPVVPFADSDGLEVGDLVLAIGDPFGVGQTVTSGIVSALARTQVGISDYQFFIQTDAAINPGNSGGPLIDMDGRLVGINTAIFSPSGGSNGIGFAIPSNMVSVVVRSARTGKAVKTPWIGAAFQNVTADVAEGLGIDVPRGALVTTVTEKSPAAKAGLKTGDLLTSVDEVEIDDPNGLYYRLATKDIGGSVRMGFTRGGKRYIATMALEEAPETVPRDAITLGEGSPFGGATVANLSPAVAEEIGYRDEPKGAVITDIPRGSIAARYGFKRGDRVVEVNGTSIDTTKRLLGVTSDRARYWEITIRRDGRTMRQQFPG
jgi:Do/DeqQ family serine protease